MTAETFRFTMDLESDEPLSQIRCSGCASLMAGHMPDPDLPERLLATCERCKSWYVMDVGATTLTLVCAPPARATSPARKKRPAQDAKRARIG